MCGLSCLETLYMLLMLMWLIYAMTLGDNNELVRVNRQHKNWENTEIAFRGITH